jgi:hypothetical protein
MPLNPINKGEKRNLAGLEGKNCVLDWFFYSCFALAFMKNNRTGIL